VKEHFYRANIAMSNSHMSDVVKHDIQLSWRISQVEKRHTVPVKQCKGALHEGQHFNVEYVQGGAILTITNRKVKM